MTLRLLIGLILFLAVSANAQSSKYGPMAKLSPSLAGLNERYTSYLAQRSSSTNKSPLMQLRRKTQTTSGLT
jgi:hypothetical protein